MLEQRIQQHFIDSADLKYQAAQALGKPISDAVQAVLACVTSGGKMLACGDGASAAHAQQFAAFCVAGFERERPGDWISTEGKPHETNHAERTR